jgi:hypothetical protein
LARVTKYSAASLLPELKVDAAKWNCIPPEQDIASSIRSIEARGIKVSRVRDGLQALEKVKEIIPPGAEIMNGSSTTLIDTGYQELMDSGRHSWLDLHKIVKMPAPKWLTACPARSANALSSPMRGSPGE